MKESQGKHQMIVGGWLCKGQSLIGNEMPTAMLEKAVKWSSLQELRVKLHVIIQSRLFEFILIYFGIIFSYIWHMSGTCLIV